jgi:hypothetical protein
MSRCCVNKFRITFQREALPSIYRMVFGQSRQEDLIIYLLAQLPKDERDGIVAELQIDFSPACGICRQDK